MLARDILQRYLDEMSDFVLRERFDEYCSRIQLPLNIVTKAANLKVSTIADLELGFDDFTEMILNLGVTDMVRTVKAAYYYRIGHVVGVYETQILNQDRLVLPKFHSKMWIGQFGGVWKAVKIHNTTYEARWPMLYTRLVETPWTIEEN